MSDSKGPPYGAEYAKSGRAACKGCKNPIDKATLRMSLRTQSRHFDGLQDNWFHFDCFWTRARKDINEAAIKGFESLKWDDQEKIRNRMHTLQDLPDDTGEAKSAIPKAEKAKSGKSVCFKCKAKIEKDSTRLGFRAAFYHPKCLADDGHFKKTAEEIVDFQDLEEEEQKKLQDIFNKKAEKRKAEEEDEIEEKKAKLEDTSEKMDALRTQSDTIWTVRDKLNNVLSKQVIIDLIEYNGAHPTRKGSQDQLLDFLVDLVVFGGLEKCPECGNGLYYSSSSHGYRCGARDAQKANCTYFTRTPTRSAFEAPKKILKEFDVLTEYNGNTILSERVYPAAVENSAHDESILTGHKENSPQTPARQKKYPPPTVVDGHEIDGLCDIRDRLQVYVEDEEPWHAQMEHEDEIEDKHSFYKIQLLEEREDDDEFYVFRSWGRLGMPDTAHKLERFDDLEAAKANFEKIFREKAKTDWDDRPFTESTNDGYWTIVSGKDLDVADEKRRHEREEAGLYKKARALKAAETRKSGGKPKKEPKNEDEYEDDFVVGDDVED